MADVALLTDTIRAETCADQVIVKFIDVGRQLAALVDWGELSHAEKITIENAYSPTAAEVAALVSKLGQWRARRDSDG